MINALLDAGARANVANTNGTTPLIIAVVESDDDCGIVECLLNHGADINQKDGAGYSPIMYAARNSYLRVAKYLVEKGANLEDRTPWSENVLHQSSLQGALQCFIFFHQQGCNLSGLTEMGYSVLDRVPPQSLSLMLPYILNTRILMDVWGEHSSRPLSNYVIWLDPTLLHKFLRSFFHSLPRGQALHLLDTRKAGMLSALCTTISKNCMTSVTRLLNFGADIEVEGSSYGTPLMYACAHDWLDAVRELVRRGARITYVDQDGAYRSALTTARAFPRIVHYLIASRFWDQPRLCAEAHGDLPKDIRLPAGVQVREVRWTEYHPPRANQSTWERLRSLENVKRRIREGKLDI